jgi:hypothetical protein
VLRIEGTTDRRYCESAIRLGRVYALAGVTYLGGVLAGSEDNEGVFRLEPGCKTAKIATPKGAELLGVSQDALILWKNRQLWLFDPATGRPRALEGEDLPTSIAACGAHICSATTGVMSRHDLLVWDQAGVLAATLDVWELSGTELWPTAVATVAGHVLVAGAIQTAEGFVAGILEVRGL